MSSWQHIAETLQTYQEHALNRARGEITTPQWNRSKQTCPQALSKPAPHIQHAQLCWPKNWHHNQNLHLKFNKLNHVIIYALDTQTTAPNRHHP